jgi:hypothetical protein
VCSSDLFTISFSKIKGNGDVNQYLYASNKNFMWCMGGGQNTCSGFELISGKRITDNPTKVIMQLEEGKKYLSTVQVRKDKVSAYFDGKLISEWKTDYADMELHNNWKPFKIQRLGLGSYNNLVHFYDIKIREMTGKGKLLR